MMPPFAIVSYTIFFAVFAVLLYCYDRDRYMARIPYGLLILWLIAFSAFRYNVGIDYAAYRLGYEQAHSEMLNHMEPVWKLLRRFLVYMNFDPSFWFLLTSLMIVGITVPFYRRYSHHFVVALLFYVVTYQLYFETFNMVRQSVAIAVSLWAWPLFGQKKYWKSLALILLAFCFHRSIIILVILLPLCHTKIPSWLFWVLLPVSLLLLPRVILPLTHQLTPLIETILPSYEVYLKKGPQEIEIGSGLNFVQKLIFSFYFLFRQRDILAKDRTLRPYFNAFFVALLLNNTFSVAFPEVKRFMYNLFFLAPLLVAALYKLGTKWDRRIVMFFIFTECLLTLKLIVEEKNRANYQLIFKDAQAPMDYRYIGTMQQGLPWQEIPYKVSVSPSHSA